LLDRGLLAPVVVAPGQDDAAVTLVFLEHVRAGAHRVRLHPLNADLLGIGLGDDVAGAEGQPLRGSRKRLGKAHDRLGRRDHLDIRHDAEADDEIDLVAFDETLVIGIGEVLGRQPRSVGEFDVVAKLDVKAQPVIRQFPFRHDGGNERQIRRLVERLVEDGFQDRLRIGGQALVGIPGDGIGHPGDRDVVDLAGKRQIGTQDQSAAGGAGEFHKQSPVDIFHERTPCVCWTFIVCAMCAGCLVSTLRRR